MTAATRDARALRVAAVIDTAIVSGPGRQLAALARALTARGVAFRVIVFQHVQHERTPYRRFLEAAGIDHVVVPYARRLDLGMLARLRRALADWSPDVVQTHHYRPTVLAWLLRRAGATWRWLGFFHGGTNEDRKVLLYHWLDRRLLPDADRVVVMSRGQLAEFPRAGSRVRQLHNAVLPMPDAAHDAPAAPAAAHDAPRPRIGFVGRLSHEKGIDVALQALRALRDRGTEATLLVAGDGPERAAAEALAEQLGLASQVRFLGTVLPVEPLYPLLDVLLISSRSEGLPNVLLEALRADVPVVSTDVGAVSEVLEDPRAGTVVPPNDPAGLADALDATLRAAGDAEARAARAATVERFSLDRRASEHLKLYDELLARGGAA